GKDGRLITESLKEYTRNAVREEFHSLDAFLTKWVEADRRQAILKELEERGVFFEELANEVGKDFSAFDLVCHVAFDQPPLTRKERATNVRKRNYFTQYGETARAGLHAHRNDDQDDPRHHAQGRWRRWGRPAHQPVGVDALPQGLRRPGGREATLRRPLQVPRP